MSYIVLMKVNETSKTEPIFALRCKACAKPLPQYAHDDMCLECIGESNYDDMEEDDLS